MAKKSTSLGNGDWIVHTYYGVGQIKGTETKQIDDAKIKYYRVETKNSVFYVPVKNIDNERIRLVASQYMLRKVKNILKAPPEELPPDHNLRKRHITEFISDCSLVVSAQLIRDLTGRKTEFSLNDHEEKTLEKLTERLILEWSIVQNIDQDNAQQQIHETLQKSIKRA